MIRYSIDKNYRIYVYFLIAFISISISPHVKYLDKLLNYKFAVTPFMLFCIVFWIFNNYLWSFPGINNILRVPNLNGKWQGTITLPITKFRDKEKIVNVQLFVTQSWSMIDLVLKGPETISSALIAHISLNNPKNIIIKWIYQVKGRTGLETVNQSSEGVTELSYVINGSTQTMEGYYYSNIGRRGYLQFKKLN